MKLQSRSLSKVLVAEGDLGRAILDFTSRFASTHSAQAAVIDALTPDTILIWPEKSDGGNSTRTSGATSVRPLTTDSVFLNRVRRGDTDAVVALIHRGFRPADAVIESIDVMQEAMTSSNYHRGTREAIDGWTRLQSALGNQILSLDQISLAEVLTGKFNERTADSLPVHLREQYIQVVSHFAVMNPDAVNAVEQPGIEVPLYVSALRRFGSDHYLVPTAHLLALHAADGDVSAEYQEKVFALARAFSERSAPQALAAYLAVWVPAVNENGRGQWAALLRQIATGVLSSQTATEFDSNTIANFLVAADPCKLNVSALSSQVGDGDFLNQDWKMSLSRYGATSYLFAEASHRKRDGMSISKMKHCIAECQDVAKVFVESGWHGVAPDVSEVADALTEFCRSGARSDPWSKAGCLLKVLAADEETLLAAMTTVIRVKSAIALRPDSISLLTKLPARLRKEGMDFVCA